MAANYYSQRGDASARRFSKTGVRIINFNELTRCVKLQIGIVMRTLQQASMCLQVDLQKIGVRIVVVRKFARGVQIFWSSLCARGVPIIDLNENERGVRVGTAPSCDLM